MKSKKTKTTISLLTIVCLAVLFAVTVSAYSTRGYYSGYVGYGNLPAYSSYLYKIETGRNWCVACTANPSHALMKYEIVNSNGESRGSGKTSNTTFGLASLTCSGTAGYKYRLKITKMSYNPLKAYYIEADWDTDVN